MNRRPLAGMLFLATCHATLALDIAQEPLWSGTLLAGDGERIYQARHDRTDWSGRLSAYALAAGGRVDGPLWEAGARLDAVDPEMRSLWTAAPAAAAGSRGIPLRWEALAPSQQAALDTDERGRGDTRGRQRLAYLRGSRADEGAGGLRVRSSRLGGMVNSRPQLVAQADFGFDLGAFPDRGYAAFRAGAQYRARPPMIYVGANDGLLHGFDARTGDERFAYMPASVLAPAARLSDLGPPGRHRYLVDGTPRVVDAVVDGRWRTVLVGGLGAGGRALFALDVTDPGQFGPASVLWEISAAEHADLGVALARPAVGRLHHGRWAALVGNGPNSATGTARLLIVDLASGALLRTIDTGAAGDNGLFEPAAVDLDGDRVVDVAYAGDLHGNLWKFDLRGPDPARWDVAYSAGGAPAPLFAACSGACGPGERQPITARPEVGARAGGAMVWFGTGRAIAPGDAGLAATNSIYGVHDAGAAIGAARRALLPQRVIEIREAVRDGKRERTRITTRARPGPEQQGWVFNLPDAGERVLTAPLLQEGRLVVSTVVPPPTAGGEPAGWTMLFDAGSGSPWSTGGGTGPAPDIAGYEGGATDLLVRAGLREYRVRADADGTLSAAPVPGGREAGRRSWKRLR